MTDIDETRIMGIDFGMKRIGIALSDSLKMFAMHIKRYSIIQALSWNLKNIVKEKNVTKFILGIPNEERQKKDSKTSVINDVKKFKESLEKNLDLKLNFGMRLILL
ncbi:MAG: Holliday junction resolvase RuvX [Ignavibacteriales bacterium]|nr:Holliday junction resolvase RuvX [Ignavibacteriales bacterium]